MKKFFITLLISFVFASAFSQNVAKECVLFEVFTGIQCPFCPAAANGIGQMMEEGLDIAPIAYHTSAFSTPEYYTSETNARAYFYNISGYPTLKADGVLTAVGGGGASESLYTQYLAKYNQRIGILSPFTIDLSYSHIAGTSNYEVVCSVNQVGDNTSNNLKIMIAITQSNIQKAWQGMTSLHHVVRDLIPTQSGTSYSGGSKTVTETFTLGDFPQEDCYITAWVQDFSTKEVFQAVRLSMNQPDYPNDIKLMSVTSLISNSCSGRFEPTISVKNRGSFDVTSFDLIVKMNEVEYSRYHWTGEPFEYGETIEVAIPEFEIPLGNSNVNIDFIVEKPNGVDDQNISGNSMTKTVQPAFETENFIKIIFVTDTKPQESSVAVINMNTNEIIKTMTFDIANNVYEEVVNLPDESCYQVVVYDTGGDGIDRQMGLFDNNENLLFSIAGNLNKFTHKIAVEVYSHIVGIDETLQSNVMIFPNPSHGQFQITTDVNTAYPVMVYDITGQEVYRNLHFSDGIIDLSNCAKGIYLIKIGLQTQKLLIH